MLLRVLMGCKVMTTSARWMTWKYPRYQPRHVQLHYDDVKNPYSSRFGGGSVAGVGARGNSAEQEDFMSSLSISDVRSYRYMTAMRDQQEQGQMPPSTLMHEEATITWPQYQLLIVSDSDDLNKLCIALSTDHHSCDQAVDPEEAMRKILHRSSLSCDERMYDAVLISLESGQGPTLATAMRILSRTVQQVSIFGITVFGHVDEQLYQDNEGVMAVLLKPFTVDFFVQFLDMMDEISKFKEGMGLGWA